MPDAETQAIKVLIIAQGADGIAQAIMAAVSATMLKARNAGSKVQFIVCNEDGFGRDLVELRESVNGLSAAVHKRGGNQQTQIAAVKMNTRGQPVEFILWNQAGALAARQLGNEIGTGIVTSPVIFSARIAQAHD